MPVVTGVELMFCMCGPLERKCTHCGGIFQEDPHGSRKRLYFLPKMEEIVVDCIKCIFCGNLTWPKDYIKRSKEEIRTERRSQSNG